MIVASMQTKSFRGDDQMDCRRALILATLLSGFTMSATATPLISWGGSYLGRPLTLDEIGIRFSYSSTQEANAPETIIANGPVLNFSGWTTINSDNWPEFDNFVSSFTDHVDNNGFLNLMVTIDGSDWAGSGNADYAYDAVDFPGQPFSAFEISFQAAILDPTIGEYEVQYVANFLDAEGNSISIPGLDNPRHQPPLPIESVPEPGSLSLLAIGLALFGFGVRFVRRATGNAVLDAR